MMCDHVTCFDLSDVHVTNVDRIRHYTGWGSRVVVRVRYLSHSVRTGKFSSMYKRFGENGDV